MLTMKKGKHRAYQKVYKRTLHLLLWSLSLRKWHVCQSVQLLVVIQGDRCLCKHHYICIYVNTRYSNKRCKSVTVFCLYQEHYQIIFDEKLRNSRSWVSWCRRSSGEYISLFYFHTNLLIRFSSEFKLFNCLNNYLQ